MNCCLTDCQEIYIIDDECDSEKSYNCQLAYCEDKQMNNNMPVTVIFLKTYAFVKLFPHDGEIHTILLIKIKI